MNDFERSKWQHPSMKNRIDAEIMAMEHGLGIDAEDPQEIEPPAVKRMKRGGRRNHGGAHSHGGKRMPLP
ncbi:hypothetical protein AZH46_00105 [Corynebacterium striatum]|nr:hypothetical protein AZH46_00105 [Corynebacterium striatum]